MIAVQGQRLDGPPAPAGPGRPSASGLQVVSGWKAVPASLQGASVALGNFDGVHLGHRQVIATAKAQAWRRACPLAVIRLTPHPRRVLRPDGPRFQLMTTAQQARALRALGVDIRYDLPFAGELASLSDEAFCREVLAEGLAVRHVTAGFDIRFGKDRSGDAASLRRWGERLGFGVSIVEAVSDRDGRISSSAVREALQKGDLATAERLLGRPFAIEGRAAGALVRLDDYVRPRVGGYAVCVRLADGRRAPAVAEVGPADARLSGLDLDVDGQTVEIELLAFVG